MWKITEDEVCLAGSSFKSYGISRGSVAIHDISTHRDEISEFVELLNRLDASEIHAYDLVEDFLGK